MTYDNRTHVAALDFSRSRPRLFVYNGLKKCDPNAAPEQWRKALKSYQVEVLLGSLTRAVLENFSASAGRTMAFHATLSPAAACGDT
jgi:hypothetical protein